MFNVCKIFRHIFLGRITGADESDNILVTFGNCTTESVMLMDAQNQLNTVIS